MDLHRLRVVEFDSLVSEKEDEKKNIAELEKRKQEDCKTFNSDENNNATNELKIPRRGSASPPESSKITSFIKTKNEIFKSSPKAKLRKQDIKNNSALPNLRKSFQDIAQNPKKRSFNLFNKKSRINKKKEDIMEFNESHKKNLEVNFLFARNTPSFIRYSRKKMKNKRNKRSDRNDLFGFQQNRSVDSRLYQTSCNYLNANKFSIKKVKNGFRRKPKLVSPVPPVNDSYCKHHAMRILSSSVSSDKKDKSHSIYYNLHCQPYAAIPVQNNLHFEEIRKNHYQCKAKNKTVVASPSGLITVPCCRDASAGPSQEFQGFQRRPVGTQRNACSAPRNVLYPRRKMSYPQYSTPSPNSECNGPEQHQPQVVACKRKRNNAKKICSIINNQRSKLYSAFIQRINACHINNNLGKKIIKYAFFGLLIVVWSPLLLAVILAWVVMCPVRFINIFAAKNENNCQKSVYERMYSEDCSCKQNKNYISSVPSWYARTANTVAKSYNALLSMLKIRNKPPMGAGSSFISGAHPNPQRRYTLFYAENRGWMMKPARRIISRSSANTRVVQTMRCEIRPKFWRKVNTCPAGKPQKKVRSTQELFYHDPCCGASTRRGEKQVKSSQDLYCASQERGAMTREIASNKKAQVKKGSQTMPYTVSKPCVCPVRGKVSCECPVHGTVSCECPVHGTVSCECPLCGPGKITSNKKAQVKKGSQTMPCTVSKPCECPVRETASCECPVHGTVSCECPLRRTGKITSNKKAQVKKGSQAMPCTVSKPCECPVRETASCECPVHGTVSCECPLCGTGKIASNKKAQVKKGSQTIPYTPLKPCECERPVLATVSYECAVHGTESYKCPAQRTVSCECLMHEEKTCPGPVRWAKKFPWPTGKSSAAGDAHPTEITCYCRELTQAQHCVSSKVSAKSIPQRKQVIPPNYSYPIPGVAAHSTIYQTPKIIPNNYNSIKMTDTFQNDFVKYRLNQRKNGILPDGVIFDHRTKYPLIMNNETYGKHIFSLAGKTLTLSTKATQNFTNKYSHGQVSKKCVTKYDSRKTNRESIKTGNESTKTVTPKFSSRIKANSRSISTKGDITSNSPCGCRNYNTSIDNKKNTRKANRERLSTRNKNILANLSRTILTKQAGTSTYKILFADKTQITSKQSLRHQVTDSATSKRGLVQKTKDSTILCNTTKATSLPSTIPLNCPYDANNRLSESGRKPELSPIKLPSKKGLVNIGIEVKPSTADMKTLCNQNSNIKECLPNRQEKALQKQPALIIKALNCPSKYEISVGTETVDLNKKMDKKTIERGCVTENQTDICKKSTKLIALNCPSKNEVSVGIETSRLKQSVYLTRDKLADLKKNTSNIKTEKQSTISQTTVIGTDQISRLNENYLQIKPSFNYPQYKNICHKETFPLKKTESYRIFIDSGNEAQPVVTDSETNTSCFKLKSKSLEKLSLKVNVSEDHSLKCKTALEHPYNNYQQITIPSDICNISEVKTSESPNLHSQTDSSLTTVPITKKLSTVSTPQYGQSSKYRELDSQTTDRCFGAEKQPSTRTNSIQYQRHDQKRTKCICTDMPDQVQSHSKKQTSSKWDCWRKNCPIAATTDKTDSSNKLQNELSTHLVRQPQINSKKQYQTQCTQVSSQRASDSQFGVVSNCPYCNNSNELLKPFLCQDKGQQPLYKFPKKATTQVMDPLYRLASKCCCNDCGIISIQEIGKRHSLNLSQGRPCECVSKMKSENFVCKNDTNKIELKEKCSCEQLKPPLSQCHIPIKQSQIVKNKSTYARETDLELRLPARQPKIKVQKQNKENILCTNESGTKYNRSKQIKFSQKQHHDFKIFSRKIKSLQKLCKILQEQAQTLEALKHPHRHTQIQPSMVGFGSNCFCKTYEPADKEEIHNCRTEAPIHPLSQRNRAAQTRSPIPIFPDKTHNKSCETSLERLFSLYKDKICTCKRESSVMWCKKRAIDCMCRCNNKEIQQVHQSYPLDKILNKVDESHHQSADLKLLKCPEKRLPPLKTNVDQPSVLSKRLSFDQSECTCEFDLQQNISQTSGKCIIVNKPQSQLTRCPSAFSKSQYSSQISLVHMECECPTSPRSSLCFCKPLRADKCLTADINKNKKPVKSKPVQKAFYCSHEKSYKTSSKTKKVNQVPRNKSLKQSSIRPCNETAGKLESHSSKVSSLIMKLRSKLCSNKKSQSVYDSSSGKCACPVKKGRQSHTDKPSHKLEPVHSSSKKCVCPPRQSFWQRLCTRSQGARTLETQSIKSYLDHPECNCRNNKTSSLKCLSEGKSRKSFSLFNQTSKNNNSIKVSSKSKLPSKTTQGSYFDIHSKYSKDNKKKQSMTSLNLCTVMSLTPIECICSSDDTSSTRNDDKSHSFLKQSRQSTLNLQKSSQQHKMLQFPSPVNNTQINSSENQRLSSYFGSKQHSCYVPCCGPHKYGRDKTSPLLHVQTEPTMPIKCACFHEKPLQMAKKMSQHSHKSVIEAGKPPVFPQQHLTPLISGMCTCAVTKLLSQKPMLHTKFHPQPSHEMPLNQTLPNKTSPGNKEPLKFLHNRVTQQPKVPKYSGPIGSQLKPLVEKEQLQQSPDIDIPRKSDIVSDGQRELLHNLPRQQPEIPQSSPPLHDFHQAFHMTPGKCTYSDNQPQNKLQPEHHLQYQVHQMYYHPPQNIHKSHMTSRGHTNSASKIPLSRTNVNNYSIKIPVKRFGVSQHVIVQRSELQNPQASLSFKQKKSIVNNNESESPPHESSISPKKTEPVDKPLPGLLQQRSANQVQQGAASREVQRYPDFNRVLMRYPGHKATRKRSEHKPPPAKVKNYPPAFGVSHSPNYARRPCYTNPANKCGPKTCFDEFALRRAYKRRPLRCTPPKQQPQKKKASSAPKPKKQKKKDKGKQKKKRDAKKKQKSGFSIFRCCQCVEGFLTKAEKEAWPDDITCRPLYIHALKHKPCFWIYRHLPSLYPAFLSCYHVHRNIAHMCKYGIAICLWSPCLLCFYICFNCLCKG